MKFQSNLFRPINKSAVGKWKTQLSESDIKLADMIVGDIAEKSGYERKYTNRNIFLLLKSFPVIGYYKLKKKLRRPKKSTPDYTYNSADKKSFFFILGRARSGTTLLRTMLDDHPNVIITLESPIILNH